MNSPRAAPTSPHVSFANARVEPLLLDAGAPVATAEAATNGFARPRSASPQRAASPQPSRKGKGRGKHGQPKSKKGKRRGQDAAQQHVQADNNADAPFGIKKKKQRKFWRAKAN